MKISPRVAIASAAIPIAIAALLAFVCVRDAPRGQADRAAGAGEARAGAGATAGPGWAGSASCRECHPGAWEAWSTSHHARAERPIDAALDRPAFGPARRLASGGAAWEARERAGVLEVEGPGADGRQAAFPVVRAIGCDPLRQYLVAPKVL